MKDEHDTVEAMTIDELATQMVKNFEDFAGMMARGFEEQRQFFREEMIELKEEMRDEFNPRFDSLEHKVDALRIDMGGVMFDVKKLKGRVENLEVHTFGSAQAV